MKATVNTKYRLTLVHDTEYQEWIVRVADRYGKRLPDLDYHTDDYEDAVATMRIMSRDLK